MSGAKAMTEPLEMLGKMDVVEIVNRVLRRWHGEVVDLDEMWRPLEHRGRQPRGTLRVPPADFPPGLRVYADPGMSLQKPFDFAVVMPSTLRPSIAEALLSVFAQDFAGRVQTWIGIDWPQSSLALLDEICAQRAGPSRCVLPLSGLFDLGAPRRASPCLGWRRDPHRAELPRQ